MRPDAPLFSPQPTGSSRASLSSPALAVVPYTKGIAAEAEKNNKSSPHTRRTGQTPQELILHETIKNLVVETIELRERCDNLEAANVGMKANMQALDAALSSQIARMPGQLTNLTGYASSEASSDCAEESAVMAGDEKLRIIEQILIEQNKRIQDLTHYKEQSSALFSSLKAELDGLHVTEAEHRVAGSFNDQGCSSEDEHNVVYGTAQSAEELATAFSHQLSAAEDQFRARLSSLKESLGARLGALESKIATVPAAVNVEHPALAPHLQAVSNRKIRPSTEAPAMPGIIEEQMAGLKRELENLQYDLAKRFEREQLIDDASTKDTLYRMFHQLGDAMFNEHARGRSGPFFGSFDELFTHRSRVIRRLALFDQLAPAIEEAKKADVDLADR